MSPFAPHSIVIQDQSSSPERWLLFTEPVAHIIATCAAEVAACLHTIDEYTAQGMYCAGYLSYEASGGLDPAMQVHVCDIPALPLLWFGVYAHYTLMDLPSTNAEFTLGAWQDVNAYSDYAAALLRIKDHIRAGATYQVNYTTQLTAEFNGDAWALFLALHAAQNGRYSAFIQLPTHSICSVSPELFFSLQDQLLTCKPMKGTVARGLDYLGDIQQRDWLAASEKNRAENLMITDMLRNDLGQLAETGSVKVEQLFALEKYPTLYQMTSTIHARSTAPFSTLISKLFPCASITGAPKIHTMQIIRELEKTPREIYTGSIGYIAPQQSHAQFNVAIRTVVVDHTHRRASYGVGSGITWDSQPEEEYQECLTKAQIVHQLHRKNTNRLTPGDIEVFESILWTADAGFYLLEEHLQRMLHSVWYFDLLPSTYQLPDLHKLFAETLQAFPPPSSATPLKAKFSLSRQEAKLSYIPLGQLVRNQLVLADAPIDSNNVFLYHKTNQRQCYTQALAHAQMHQTCQDVILYNEAGQITESCIANIVIEHEGYWITPPTQDGLLPGVLRQQLLSQGVMREQSISRQALLAMDRIYLINSVRGWMECTQVQPGQWRMTKISLNIPSKPYKK